MTAFTIQKSLDILGNVPHGIQVHDITLSSLSEKDKTCVRILIFLRKYLFAAFADHGVEMKRMIASSLFCNVAIPMLSSKYDCIAFTVL